MTTVWLALFILSLLVFVASFVWVLVLSYRESMTWGLISTFVPFGAVAFAVKFWTESRRAVIPCAAALVFATVCGLGFSISKVNTNLGVDSGGADLWADSSGFEAMTDTNSSAFETSNATPDSESIESTEMSSSAGESTETDDVPQEDSTPQEDSALEQLADSAASNVVTPTPNSRRGRRHSVVPLEQLPELEGERAALILKDGERVFGIIEQVGSSKVVIRKIVGGGSILFTLRRSDIAEIQTRHWR